MSILLALGPSHPQWPGPQQLLVRVAGETVIDVDYRVDESTDELEQTLSRGDAKRALLMIASGKLPHRIAHSLALCQATEQLAGVEVPPRAAVVRAVAAEIERLASHSGAVAALLGLMGMERRQTELLKLEQAAIAALHSLAGEQAAELLTPGGLHINIGADKAAETLGQLAPLGQSLYRLIDRLIDDRLLLRRTVGVGVLSRAAAEQFGVRGPVARASGIARDVRLDHAYAGYARLEPQMITQEGGDVYARLVLLLLEAFESVKLAERGLSDLPDGPCSVALPDELPPGRGSAQVEGPSGMLRYQIEAEGSRLRQVQIDAPRQMDRLLARTLLDRALVDNSLLIAASAAPAIGAAQ